MILEEERKKSLHERQVFIRAVNLSVKSCTRKEVSNVRREEQGKRRTGKRREGEEKQGQQHQKKERTFKTWGDSSGSGVEMNRSSLELESRSQQRRRRSKRKSSKERRKSL